MADASIYEAYREALRRGHVAVLRGRLDEALGAYADAAAIAPDRSVPHAALGRVLGRMGRSEDALVAFGRALALSPGDETALAGRADLRLALGRRVEAADDLVALAEAQERDGRIADASDTARHALEIAESRARRALVRRLAERLRAEGGDDAAVAALERALILLESAPSRELAADETARPGMPANLAPPNVALDSEAAEADAASGAPGAEPHAEMDEAGTRDPEALFEEAERLRASGDTEGARLRFLASAEAQRRLGRPESAFDACFPVLAIRPSDPDLHLFLAELYLELGWRGVAAEKLALLARLAELTGDAETADRTAAAAAGRAGTGSRG